MNATAMRAITWVKPGMVAQVRFTEWTDDGLLRHPVFLGLRTDRKARDVVREAPPVGEPSR
ncbi:putative DNA ligase-like protein [compost metagenome]